MHSMEQQLSNGQGQRTATPLGIEAIRQHLHRTHDPFETPARVGNYSLAVTMAYTEQPYIETAIKNLGRIQKLHALGFYMPANAVGNVAEKACSSMDWLFLRRARTSIKLGEKAAAARERDFLKRLPWPS